MINVSRQLDISESVCADDLFSLILILVYLTLKIIIPTLFKLLFIIFKQVANECV